MLKERFHQIGLAVARGRVCHTLSEVKTLVAEVGYPIVAKPDSGVGASQTYKLHTDTELETFFSIKPPVEYIFEEFINGEIETFDGLTDRDGRIVFSSSLHYNAGVMELVNERRDFWYFTQREIPPALEVAGKRVVQAYQLRERFSTSNSSEPGRASIRAWKSTWPTGGLTVDMWNYSEDIDIYYEYANIVMNNCFHAPVTRPYYCAYVSGVGGVLTVTRTNKFWICSPATLQPTSRSVAFLPPRLVITVICSLADLNDLAEMADFSA